MRLIHEKTPVSSRARIASHTRSLLTRALPSNFDRLRPTVGISCRGAAASPANPVRGSAMGAITKLNTRAANPRRVAAIIKLAF
jgi:hypothetical protein